MKFSQLEGMELEHKWEKKIEILKFAPYQKNWG